MSSEKNEIFEQREAVEKAIKQCDLEKENIWYDLTFSVRTMLRKLITLLQMRPELEKVRHLIELTPEDYLTQEPEQHLLKIDFPAGYFSFQANVVPHGVYATMVMKVYSKSQLDEIEDYWDDFPHLSPAMREFWVNFWNSQLVDEVWQEFDSWAHISRGALQDVTQGIVDYEAKVAREEFLMEELERIDEILTAPVPSEAWLSVCHYRT